MAPKPDAVVVGSGPNGLAAAITLAQAGWSVRVLEAEETPGGGCRSAELTRPGFIHDTCSAVHPMAAVSPFFRQLDLLALGAELVQPELPVAHPLDGGDAGVVERSLDATVAGLGRDGANYRRLIAPLVSHWEVLMADAHAPLHLPAHPVTLTRFGLGAIWPASWLIRAAFREDRARALLAGMAAHSIQRLQAPLTAALSLIFPMTAHAVGWPIVRGGSQKLTDALIAHLKSLGGEVVCGQRVTAMDQLGDAGVYLFDVTPRQLLTIASSHLTPGYRQRLQRYRHGPGVFKLDWALSQPIPWTNTACSRAGTVHVAGRFEEIEASEDAVARGKHPEKPFVILAQPSLSDPSRAPQGRHTAWAYCHVPRGSNVDMTVQIEDQVARFAPGFRDVIIARSEMPPAEIERRNANYVGGDITGGVQDLRQFWTRPVASRCPYATPNPRIFICSSSTPPGVGVHGMCGWWAAQAVLKRSRRKAA